MRPLALSVVVVSGSLLVAVGVVRGPGDGAGIALFTGWIVQAIGLVLLVAERPRDQAREPV